MLRLVNMSKKFASQTVVKNVSLEIQDGEFFSLLGPSGCGKTTLLRILAGFESPDDGQIFWNEHRIDCMPPQERPFNIVFQKYALFPHLSVYENIEFGLKIKKVSEPERHKRVTDAIELVGLSDFSLRKPETLSGGQAQRVAIARAIVNEPKVLLLDEPLSALDQSLRTHMQAELRKIQRKLDMTFVLVTHDQEEALALSDRIGVMNKGQLEQVGSPLEMYSEPKTHFVGQFMGSMGSLLGRSSSSTQNISVLEISNGQFIKGRGQVDSATAEAFVRPDRIQIGEKLGEDPAMNYIRGEVLHIGFKGLHYEVQIGVGQNHLRVFISRDSLAKNLDIGYPVGLSFSAEDTFIFARPNALVNESEFGKILSEQIESKDHL